MTIRNTKICFFTALFLNFHVVFDIGRILFSIINISIDTELTVLGKLPAVFTLLFTFAVFLKRKYVSKYVVYIFFTWLFLFLHAWITIPGFDVLVPRATIYFLNSVVCVAYLISLLKDDDLLLFVRYLKIFAQIGAIYSILFWFFPPPNESYSMAYSYGTAVVSLLSVTCFAEEKGKIRWLYFFLFLVYVATNLMFGSRGVFACYGVLFCIIVIFNIKHLKTWLLGIGFVSTSLFVSRGDIYYFLMERFPISRNMWLLFGTSEVYLSGRDKIYGFLLSEIDKNQFLFRGLYSDRFAVANYFDMSGLENVWGMYAHNFFIETIFQFGVGAICFLVPMVIFFMYVFFEILYINNVALKILFAVFFSFAIGQLMVSSSYLVSPCVGAVVGVTILICRRAKNIRILL